MVANSLRKKMEASERKPPQVALTFYSLIACPA